MARGTKKAGRGTRRATSARAMLFAAAPTSIAAKSEALEAFRAAYHTVRAGLFAQSQANSAKMSEIFGDPTKQAQFNALAAEQITISDTLQEYALVQNMALNNSAAVQKLIKRVDTINKSIAKSLSDLQKIVKVVQNLNGFIATLNSLLNAAKALAAVIL